MFYFLIILNKEDIINAWVGNATKKLICEHSTSKQLNNINIAYIVFLP